MTNNEFTNLMKLFLSTSEDDRKLAYIIFNKNKKDITDSQLGEFSLIVLYNHTLFRNKQLEIEKLTNLLNINGLFHETMKRVLKEKGYI